MKFQTEFRNSDKIRALAVQIQSLTSHPWRVMEVCGGQTNTIMRYGLDKLVQPIEFLHGPGCPICVTPIHIIDQAIALSRQDQIILCSFADLLRVPGTESDFVEAKAMGAAIRTVYTPLEAVQLAEKNPDKEIVFLAIGFETTAPINALSVLQAKSSNVTNFSLLVSQVLVPPAIRTLMQDRYNQIDAFLAAGHVCSIMGTTQYQKLVDQYHIPIVVTGFEPWDILSGLYFCIEQLEKKTFSLTNQYQRVVREEGNLHAQAALEEVFVVCDQAWRGIGEIPQSGLQLRSKYDDYNALKKFPTQFAKKMFPNECISGAILKGKQKPPQCPAFGSRCTPEHPLGAPMVSEEGACQAYYHNQGTSHV